MLAVKVPNFGPKKVPILYTSPKFHPYNKMPRQSPKFKILDCKHCLEKSTNLSKIRNKEKLTDKAIRTWN